MRPTVDECMERANADTVRKSLSKEPLAFPLDINLGDWSNDGHGKTRATRVTCNKSLDMIVNAFKKAAKKFPIADPTTFFEEYEDSSLTEKVYLGIFNTGYDLLAGFNEPEERARRLKEIPEETWEEILQYPQMDEEEFALYILWFCQQGDSGLQFHMEEKVPSLFGYAGIRDGAGYGLFR